MQMEPKIQFSSSALTSVLSAVHEREESDDPLYDVETFRFSDPLLKYHLTILPNLGSVQIAMDPDEPIQPCPMLEYSLNCCEIVIEQRASSLEPENAVRFYEHKNDRGGLRLTLTPRWDRRWYTWVNTWHDPGDAPANALPWKGRKQP
jgi:hypothetical protein